MAYNRTPYIVEYRLDRGAPRDESETSAVRGSEDRKIDQLSKSTHTAMEITDS